MNIKRLGKKQKHYLRELLYKNRVIRVVRDCYENIEEASVQDEEGNNDYETVDKDVLQSLCDRKLLDVMSWIPSLQIEIITFRIKSKCKAALLGCVQK